MKNRKNIYLVRHCAASGQEPEAALTNEGRQQAKDLVHFLTDKSIDYIVSSPFIRAIHSITPLSERINKTIHIDTRLRERVLSSVNLNDWMEKLKETYLNLDLKLEGGESSNEAISRGMEVVDHVKERTEQNIVVVTHGALMSLLIRNFDNTFGFNNWMSLSNPDVYHLEIADDIATIKRIWK